MTATPPHNTSRENADAEHRAREPEARRHTV